MKKNALFVGMLISICSFIKVKAQDYSYKWNGASPYFTNGTANLVSYIDFGDISISGYMEITLSGSFSHQNTNGTYSKRYAIGRNAGQTIYSSSSEVAAAFGPVATQWKLGEFEINGANHLILPIYHLVSTGNSIMVSVSGLSTASIDTSLIQISTPQVIANNQTRDYVYFNDRVGIGTVSPDAKLQVVGDIHGSGLIAGNGAYFNVLKIPALSSSPAYFYIDTNIPASDSSAPQLQITGYMYGSSNKAMKVTLGWYYWQGNFYWSQYQSDLGYSRPSRIRLGKYIKNGSSYIRIEISNNSSYWANYTVNATDRADLMSYYTGWSFYEGEMPSETTSGIIEVSQQKDITVDGKVGIGTASPDNILTVKGENATVDIQSTADGQRPGLFMRFQNSAYAGSNFYYNTADANTYLDNLYPNTAGTNYGSFNFRTRDEQGQLTSRLLLHGQSGNIGIGTATPKEKLSVNGKIRAHEIKVETANWPDYVFEDGYKVGTLEELEGYIKANKRLPEMPSAKELESNGLLVSEMLKLQQKKIEELTLHLIEQNKQIQQLFKEVKELKEQQHKNDKK